MEYLAKCPSCDSLLGRQSPGEVICSNCGQCFTHNAQQGGPKYTEIRRGKLVRSSLDTVPDQANQEDNEIFLADVERVSNQLVIMSAGNLKVPKHTRAAVSVLVLAAVALLKEWNSEK